MKEPQFQEQIALYKRQENLESISAWAPPGVRRLLRTDLFEEGFGKDSLLDALVGTYPTVVGMDISHVVAAAARGSVTGVGYVVSDTCALPFQAQSLDLPLHVLSNHIRRWTGRIYAERCYTVSEVRAAPVRQPVAVTGVTAIYHVSFPVNFLRRNCASTRAPAPMPGSRA